MSRRDKIRLSEFEIRAFLLESKTLTIVSNGPRGFPHPMPMWFALDDDLSVRITTYAKSQKVRNIERDPRVSVLVESGEAYEELKGVVLYGHAELIRDVEQVIDTLVDINRFDRADPQVREGMQGNAAKRVLIRVRPERIVSWDHSKLGGVY
ncbi:MAG: pyridoxamine 5'-phosphate oxidase family protein [Myxococcota bacterium]